MSTKNSKKVSKSAPTNHKNSGTGATAHTSESVDREVEVLYQKMGGRWYAFSVIDDDVFFGSIDSDDLNHPEAQKKAA